MMIRFKSLFVSMVALMAVATVAAGAGELRGRVSGADGGTVVVWIEGLSGPVSAGRDTVIKHVDGGRFEPVVSVGFVGNQFVLGNDDDTLHNIHLSLDLARQKKASSRPLKEGATLYNIAFPIRGMEVKRPIRSYHEFRTDTGVITARCNPHPEEQAWVLVFAHPYATVTDSRGDFVLSDVPPGRHDLWTWHAGHHSKWGSVEVKSSGTTEIEIEVSASGAAE